MCLSQIWPSVSKTHELRDFFDHVTVGHLNHNTCPLGITGRGSHEAPLSFQQTS
jgi:hypothetical protein